METAASIRHAADALTKNRGRTVRHETSCVRLSLDPLLKR